MKKKQIITTILSILCLLSGITSCSESQNKKTSPFPEIKVTGNETWKIKGIEYKIIGVSVIFIPKEKPFLVVKVFSDKPVSTKDEVVAKSIAKYAITNGYLKKAEALKITEDKKRVELSKGFGVSMLFEKKIGFLSHSSGYNFKFTEADLKGL